MKDPISILNPLEKLIVEHGSATVMKSHIALLRDVIAEIQKENEDLKKVNSDLVERNAELSAKLSETSTPSEFINWKGVLIKTMPDGGHHDVPFCAKCKMPLSSIDQHVPCFCTTTGCGSVTHITIHDFESHLKTLN